MQMLTGTLKGYSIFGRKFQTFPFPVVLLPPVIMFDGLQRLHCKLVIPVLRSIDYTSITNTDSRERLDVPIGDPHVVGSGFKPATL
jgi:hypothetical protein